MNYQGEFTTWKSMWGTPIPSAIFGINNQKKRKEDYRDWVIKEHK